MNNLKENLHNVRARVVSACKMAGRNPADVAILAVSKRHPVERIQALHGLGQASFGENYVQEALAKMGQLPLANLEWHFIGPLQSNKTREVAEHFQWVQSVDRALPEPPLGPSHLVTHEYLDSLEDASIYFRGRWTREDDCSDLGRIAAYDTQRLVDALRHFLPNVIAQTTAPAGANVDDWVEVVVAGSPRNKGAGEGRSAATCSVTFF